MIAATGHVEDRETTLRILSRLHSIQARSEQSHRDEDGSRTNADDVVDLHSSPPVFFVLITAE